jgi:hypothetical protein
LTIRLIKKPDHAIARTNRPVFKTFFIFHSLNAKSRFFARIIKQRIGFKCNLAFQSAYVCARAFTRPSRYRGPRLLQNGSVGLHFRSVLPAFSPVSTRGKPTDGVLHCCPFGISALLVSIPWRSEPQARETLVSCSKWGV